MVEHTQSLVEGMARPKVSVVMVGGRKLWIHRLLNIAGDPEFVRSFQLGLRAYSATTVLPLADHRLCLDLWSRLIIPPLCRVKCVAAAPGCSRTPVLSNAIDRTSPHRRCKSGSKHVAGLH